MRRRSFLRNAGLGAGALALSAPATTGQTAQGGRPVVISSHNGLKAIEKAMDKIAKGADGLDAVIAGVNLVEEDPDDITVGYGGLPNERGVVELDASVMHGPSAMAGAVAALRGIKYPSRVARLVMEQTDHVLLVGEGALEYARAQGFTEENLLTEKARRIWLHWKQTLSEKDDWIPPPEAEWSKDVKEYLRTYGTIHCGALDTKGNLSGVTTTSGLFMKLPGRVGDSALIGAGLYVDNEYGSCGSTGRGEAVILAGGSHAVVENLRRGMLPEQAALKVLEWIAGHTTPSRLKDADGRPDFNVSFYVIDKKGRHAGAALWSESSYTLHDGASARKLDSAYLFKRKPKR
ncbi:MAG TPA: N(4)-(beta-N-acetylglucosaminyl)-L-asparaginase [Candidatus Polarisedimenticolia bacterium]|nr:N(4)-(beta-N-acetylglucosaminyl)-L-asparaginase [Candidatus Polarisedimenticolia bacterium]